MFFLIEKTFDFLIDFPRPTLNVYNTPSPMTTLT
jgi:hypothetical protein